MTEPVVHCPSCGAEYVAGTARCADCRVALVPETQLATTSEDEVPPLIEMGTWPRVQAQLLRRRLEHADVSVFLERRPEGAALFVGDEQADFADAVIREVEVGAEAPEALIDVLDELDEHLAAAAGLLEELRLRVADDG